MIKGARHESAVFTNSKPATTLPITLETGPIHLITPYRSRSNEKTSTKDPTSKL